VGATGSASALCGTTNGVANRSKLPYLALTRLPANRRPRLCKLFDVVQDVLESSISTI
jgi:hypothetical protein